MGFSLASVTAQFTRWKYAAIAVLHFLQGLMSCSKRLAHVTLPGLHSTWQEEKAGELTSTGKVVLCSAVDVLKKDGAAPLPRDLDGLQKTLDRLQECLARAHAYGEEVVVCAFLIKVKIAFLFGLSDLCRVHFAPPAQSGCQTCVVYTLPHQHNQAVLSDEVIHEPEYEAIVFMKVSSRSRA